jgi:hypothetical protein
MPKYMIPKNAGRFRVITARAGNWLVLNDRTGNSAIKIPCRTREQADEICEKLNSGNHQGEIRA